MTAIGKMLFSPIWFVFRVIGIILAFPLILMALRNNPEYYADEDDAE